MPLSIWSTLMPLALISWAAVRNGQSWSKVASESYPPMNQIQSGQYYTSGCVHLVIVQRHVDDVLQNTSLNSTQSLISLFLYYNSLSCYMYMLHIWHIWIVIVATKCLCQKAGFTTLWGNSATCTPDGGKANTTTTAKLKGQNRHPLIFYGCCDNTDQYKLNCVLSTPCFSQYLTPASWKKKNTGLVNN